MPGEQDAHNRVAYPGYAYPHTHPDRLAVMGMLHGVAAAPVDHCRVLEIGCNEAANLIPMAYAIPGSEFVGFDLASQPIARGQQRIAALKLPNIQIFQADLMDVGEAVGMFDYIIAHGVYAWVPEPVRDRLLAFCREHLRPNGIACISYNALPGGYLRNMVGDILRQGMAGGVDPMDDVSHALMFLSFIAEARPQDDPFRALLEKEAKKLELRGPQGIFHDELCSEQRPVYFSALAAHAARNGLQYLSEAVLPLANDPCFQPQVSARAKAASQGDVIAEEQILDFARMRTYRETLLCHTGLTVSSDLRLAAFGRLRLASPAESSQGEAAGVKVYTMSSGAHMESQHDGTVTLMEALIAAWPQSVPFADVAALLERKRIALQADFYTLLLRLTITHMIELHAWAAPVSSRIAVRPRASASSRWEAAVHFHATTLLHSSLGLADPQVRRFLLLLDGTRDRVDLLQALRAEYPDLPEVALAEGIEASLRLLHRTGVLLADNFT